MSIIVWLLVRHYHMFWTNGWVHIVIAAAATWGKRFAHNLCTVWSPLCFLRHKRSAETEVGSSRFLHSKLQHWCLLVDYGTI